MTGCIKRSISVLLCLVMLTAMLVAIIPESTVQVSALTYRTGANGAHSSYMGSKFYRNFQKLELTGDGRTDVLAVALSQLGYQESPTAYDFDGIGGGSGNYTEYCYNMGDFGYGYGGGNYAWCATFVSWALYQARCTDQGSMSDWTRNHSGNSNYIWREVGCAMWANQLRTCGYFQRSKAYNGNTYQPQSGDLIFFCWDGPSGGEDHIGIVVYSDSSYVYTIEGNTSNQNGLNADGGGVYFKKYALDYYYITGYGVLPYKTNSAVKKIDYSGANPTPGYYVCNASKYIYATETATDVSYYSERFSMFEVVGVASNGRLKVKGVSTTTGAVVDGYILNNDDRVIQLSCSASTPRDELHTSITAAKGVRYDYYTEANLATLRSAYTEACTLYNDSNSSDTQLTAAKQKLDKALANTVASAENVVSKGKSYTTTESGRTDIYVDDGKRLTDGVKGNTDGGNNMFSGYNSNDTIEVVLDMGGNLSTNTYRIYAAKMESWGITAPEKLAISVSNDGVNFTDVSYTTVRYRTSGTTDTWNMFTYTVKTNTTRTERYIKFTVTSGGNHVWLEEVEAMNNPIAASGRVYVTGVNKYITAGDTVIFTPDQGEINVTNFNISYTTNVVATWNGANYVVSSVTTGTGTDTPAITLNSNQILVACHEWESGTDDPILGSRANSATVKNLKVGDVLTLTNVDIANKALAVAPVIEVKTTSSTPVEKPADAKVFWVTHINDHNSEGAGAIFTSAYEGAVWWLHVAFAPTGTAGVYKITAISDGIPEGKGEAQAIPEGGFVYAINKGNNYIELGIG
ncbi:MAG: CHAP domain-containing protein, partial [Clostridia bacterium]|nr:CHAP domain-containing protein [Clostridia bacterium]